MSEHRYVENVALSCWGRKREEKERREKMKKREKVNRKRENFWKYRGYK